MDEREQRLLVFTTFDPGRGEFPRSMRRVARTDLDTTKYVKCVSVDHLSCSVVTVSVKGTTYM